MKTKLKNILLILAMAAFVCLAMTGCVTAGASGNATATGGYTSIIMMVVIIAVFYFLMIRPEQKKKKKADEMRNNLSVGDKITTIGGMVGKIVNISGDLITFETGEDRVRIQVTKWAISTNSIQKEEDPK